MAMNADKIVAHPGTLTGSIGVVAGKMASSARGHRGRLEAGRGDGGGIEWGQGSRGRNATIWSPLTPYSESESQRLDNILDDIYGAFVRNVAEARRLPVGAVRDIAKGRG